jgi:hypothetical protein
MHGPADMEGHLAKDGKYYLLDFARCFPPEAPSKFTKSIFSQLLRPELLQSFGNPLSSDAFSKYVCCCEQASDDRVRANVSRLLIDSHLRSMSSVVAWCMHARQIPIRSPTSTT